MVFNPQVYPSTNSNDVTLGMSLLDRFAEIALKEILNSHLIDDQSMDYLASAIPEDDYKRIAVRAYAVAHAMLMARRTYPEVSQQ